MRNHEDRRRQALTLSRQLRERMTLRLQKHLLPVEGQWLDADAVQRLMARNRRQAWVVLVELLLLFAFMGAIAFVITALTNLLAY